MRLRLAAPAAADASEVQNHRQEQPQPVEALNRADALLEENVHQRCERQEQEAEEHGRMNVPKARSIITGRAIHANSSMMRENDETKAVKHPELLDLILITFPFQDREGCCGHFFSEAC